MISGVFTTDKSIRRGFVRGKCVKGKMIKNAWRDIRGTTSQRRREPGGCYLSIGSTRGFDSAGV